jgi:hypothetical protein
MIFLTIQTYIGKNKGGIIDTAFVCLRASNRTNKYRKFQTPATTSSIFYFRKRVIPFFPITAIRNYQVSFCQHFRNPGCGLLFKNEPGITTIFYW